MSEASQQERLHASLGGTMISEFRVVGDKGGGTREMRWIDSVILPYVPYVEMDGVRTTVLDGRVGGDGRERLLALMRPGPVVCVQSKTKRLGPRLLGQTLFSRGLLEAEGIEVARSIALCGAREPELEAIAVEDFGLEVIVDEQVRRGAEPAYLKRHDAGVKKYVDRLEASGVVSWWSRGPLMMRSGSKVVVDALIIRGSKPSTRPMRWKDLDGLDVTVVTSTQARVCMYSLGVAVFSRALAERAGARAEAVVVAKDTDSALAPLLKDHPSVSVVAAGPVGSGPLV